MSKPTITGAPTQRGRAFKAKQTVADVEKVVTASVAYVASVALPWAARWGRSAPSFSVASLGAAPALAGSAQSTVYRV